MNSRKTSIKNLLAQINDHEDDEAFRSIEHIEIRPYEGKMSIRFCISAVARMKVSASGDEFALEAECMETRTVKASRGISALRRFIYDLDALLADGYRQTDPKIRITLLPPPPPPEMDIPVWNEKSKTWYDAEY